MRRQKIQIYLLRLKLEDGEDNGNSGHFTSLSPMAMIRYSPQKHKSVLYDTTSALPLPYYLYSLQGVPFARRVGLG